ncbi:MAG: hypothetical protein J5680_06340 [Neisseriaceae bacterium]|nr:hypothetical protein [Neisseriaceae bacterium]
MPDKAKQNNCSLLTAHCSLTFRQPEKFSLIIHIAPIGAFGGVLTHPTACL